MQKRNTFEPSVINTFKEKSQLPTLCSSRTNLLCNMRIVLKFIYSEKATKSSPYFWLALHRTKVRWRFRKMLWPSEIYELYKSKKSYIIFFGMYYRVSHIFLSEAVEASQCYSFESGWWNSNVQTFWSH